MEEILQKIVIPSLIEIRTSQNMTQKKLAEITGIDQSDISKIERGVANPSISTLQRLADGLGVEMTIEFKKVE